MNANNTQLSTYIRKEYQMNKVHQRKDMKNISYEELKKFREESCSRDADTFQLQPHQIFSKQYMKPTANNQSLLLFHRPGTGKTCIAIQIAEQYKKQVMKYGTKIYVLVSGPLLEQNFINEMLGPCGNSSYMNHREHDKYKKGNTKIFNKAYEKIRKHYEIMSYRSFLGRVLGHRIKNEDGKAIKDNKGEDRRDIPVNRIQFLTNTIIIVDEAHNLTGNDEGNALLKLLRHKRSKNLKLVLMTATPMKNVATDVMMLYSFLSPFRSLNYKKMFDISQRNAEVRLTKGWEKYFLEHINGKISYVRGADPILYATQQDMGTLDTTEFTPLIHCKMSPFQEKVYRDQLEVLKYKHDALSKSVMAISNIVVPGLTTDRKSIKGLFSNEGIMRTIQQLKKSELLSVLRNHYKNINLRVENGRLKGNLFHIDNLYNFSTKYYHAILEINKNVVGQKGGGTCFVYANAVVAGIAIFEEVLNENGYMPYLSAKKRKEIPKHIRCSTCGVSRAKHTDHDHQYYPSCYITLTGENEASDNKNKDIIQQVFNHPTNANGSLIKVILGSSVMKEGVSLLNVKETHILDTPYNLTRLDQVIGRAIRFCSHIEVISEDNPTPIVRVYRYISVFSSKKKEYTIDQSIYRDAEAKYKVIKQIEHAMQKGSIDCPLMIEKNIFPEEIQEFKDCEKNGTCPVQCNFVNCQYSCSDEELNKKFMTKSGKYKQPDKLNDAFFNKTVMDDEILFAKNIIKVLYRTRMTYTLETIVQKVKNQYPQFKKNFFDPFFVYKALDDFVPNTDNKKNNFQDPLIDMQDREGYLIHRKNMYIFQPSDIPEKVSIRRRLDMEMPKTRHITLETYLHYKSSDDMKQFLKKDIVYRYNNKYYADRDENEILGVISKTSAQDVFNIRYARDRMAQKKRVKGLATDMGASCTSKSLEELLKICATFNIKNIGASDRRSKQALCTMIQKKLFDLEKNGTGEKKKTYLKIPMNHPHLKFPINVEDRLFYIKDQLEHVFYERSDIQVSMNEQKTKFMINCESGNFLPDDIRLLNDLKADKKNGQQYIINI